MSTAALISGICWTIVYICTVYRGMKDKSYGMPLVALALNLTWEFTYSFIYPPTDAGIGLTVINTVWCLLDVVILPCLCLYAAAWPCLAITADHYDLVYSSPLSPGDDSDLIRKRLNEKRPKSFSGHSVSTGDVIAINQAGVTQYYYLEHVGFIRLPVFIEPSAQSSESDSRKLTSAAGSSGGERIITLRTKDYLLKGRKGLWLAEDMLLVDSRPFFLLQHQDFGNDAAFTVVDEHGNQVAYDSYDGFTDDVIRQSRQFLQREKEQRTQPEAGPDKHDQTHGAFLAMAAQRIEESIQLSNLQLGNSSPPLENWQKSYQNGEYIRSAESGEEANYNMVDGLHNNRKKRKKKKRRFVLKRLHEKQMEVAKREKRVPYQDLPQFMQEHEIERKSNN